MATAFTAAGLRALLVREASDYLAALQSGHNNKEKSDREIIYDDM